MKLAGLAEGTRREYLPAVRQLAAYYLVPPDRLSERQVQSYILYARGDLGVAKGTFAPLLAGLKLFYLNTLGYESPLLSKKKAHPDEARAARYTPFVLKTPLTSQARASVG
jgi:hypothetical protein